MLLLCSRGLVKALILVGEIHFKTSENLVVLCCIYMLPFQFCETSVSSCSKSNMEEKIFILVC